MDNQRFITDALQSTYKKNIPIDYNWGLLLQISRSSRKTNNMIYINKYSFKFDKYNRYKQKGEPNWNQINRKSGIEKENKTFWIS